MKALFILATLCAIVALAAEAISDTREPALPVPVAKPAKVAEHVRIPPRFVTVHASDAVKPTDRPLNALDCLLRQLGEGDAKCPAYVHNDLLATQRHMGWR